MTQYSAKLDKEDIDKLRVMYPGFSISKAVKSIIRESDRNKSDIISQKDILKIYEDKLTAYTGKLETKLKKIVGDF